MKQLYANDKSRYVLELAQLSNQSLNYEQESIIIDELTFIGSQTAVSSMIATLDFHDYRSKLVPNSVYCF